MVIAFSLTSAGVRPLLLNSRHSLAGRGLSLREKRWSSRQPRPAALCRPQGGRLPGCPLGVRVCPLGARLSPQPGTAGPGARPLQPGPALLCPGGTPRPRAPGPLPTAAPARRPRAALPPQRRPRPRHFRLGAASLGTALRAGKREGENNPNSPLEWPAASHFPVIPCVCPGLPRPLPAPRRGRGCCGGAPAGACRALTPPGVPAARPPTELRPSVTRVGEDMSEVLCSGGSRAA